MALGFLKRGFLENPLVGRQLSTQLTGPRLGIVFALVAGSLLLTDAITLSTLLLSDRSGTIEGMAARLLCLINFLLLYGLLALLLPVRVAGAIDGPRFDKAFDQLVVTGASPIQLQLGNWALGFLYALFILLVSLPFQVYACMLGGVELSGLAWGYGVLALYSNVIIAVTLAFCVLEREWLAAPAAIGIFLLGGFLSFAPLPAALAWATPVRLFWPLPMWTLSGSIVGGWFAEPVLFFQAIPQRVYRFLLWAIIAAPCVVFILLGPSHRFLPGVNNFGNVVLAGDRRRRFFRKVRFALTRKVELAFFYENRPRWLDGIDYPLRAVVGLGAVVFFWGVITGLCFDGAPDLAVIGPRFDFFGRDSFAFSIGFTSAALFVALLLLGDPRPKLAWRERVGRWSVPRGWLLSGCFLLLLGGFALLHELVLESALENAAASPVPAMKGPGVDAFATHCRQFVGSLVLFFLNCHLLGKILTRLSGTAAVLRIQILLAAGAAFCGPLIVLLGMEERWIPPDLFPLVFISPLVQYMARDAGFKKIAPRGFDLEQVFPRHMAWQVGFTVVLVAVLVLILVLTAAIRARSRANGAGTKPPRSPAATGAAVLMLLAALSGAFSPLDAQPAPPDSPDEKGEEDGKKTLPLQADLTHGFEGRLIDADVDFFTLVLKNTSDQPIRGTFRIELDRNVSTSLRQFDAPPGTSVPIRWSEDRFPTILMYPSSSLRLVLEAPGGRLVKDMPGVALMSQGSPQDAKVYLEIADDERGERGPSVSVGGEKGRIWVPANTFFLPEDHRPYAGAQAVFVGPTDLSRWTPGQRRALLDFVRLGGAVFFHGPIDRASLKGAGEWEELLATRSSSRAARDGAELIVEDLEEGESLAWLDAAGGSPAVPLISARAVGPGTIGHLSSSLKASSARPDVWSALWAALPGSRYPSGVSLSRSDDLELRDSTSLLAVLGYFAMYSLVLGPAGFFAFRRKSRRRWMPLWIIGLPAAFVVLLPALHASLHLRPSYASLTRAVFFAPGSRHGVTQAMLEVRSSGRQQHRLALWGDGLSAFVLEEVSQHYPAYGNPESRIAPLASYPPGEGAHDLQLSLNPWGRKKVLFLGSASYETPITGKALHDARMKRLSLRAIGLPATEEKPLGRVAFRLPCDKQYRTASLSGASFEGGVLTLELPLDPVSNELSETLLSRAILEPGDLGLSLPSRPFVFLVLEGLDPGLDVTSKDLAFEREVAELPRAPGPDAAKQKSVRRKKALPGRTAGTIEKDGKIFRSFQRTLFLQELPLETR